MGEAGTVDNTSRLQRTVDGSGNGSGELSWEDTPPPPQRREQWVPKAEEKMNSQSRGGRGGAVQEGAEMVRGVSPWGLLGNWDSAPATCSREYLAGGGPQAVRETLRELGFAPG